MLCTFAGLQTRCYFLELQLHLRDLCCGSPDFLASLDAALHRFGHHKAFWVVAEELGLEHAWVWGAVLRVEREGSSALLGKLQPPQRLMAHGVVWQGLEGRVGERRYTHEAGVLWPGRAAA